MAEAKKNLEKNNHVYVWKDVFWSSSQDPRDGLVTCVASSRSEAINLICTHYESILKKPDTECASEMNCCFYSVRDARTELEQVEPVVYDLDAFVMIIGGKGSCD